MIRDRFNPRQTGTDALVAGYYLIERQGRVAVPVRIWFGAPEEDGEPLDRSPRWQLQVGHMLIDDEEPLRVGGVWINDISDIWPAVARCPTDEADWRYRLDRSEWAQAYDQNDAFADLGSKIDPMTVTLP